MATLRVDVEDIVLAVFSYKVRNFLRNMYDEVEPSAEGRPEEHRLITVQVEFDLCERMYVFAFDFAPRSTPAHMVGVVSWRLVHRLEIEFVEDLVSSIKSATDDSRIDYFCRRVVLNLYASAPVNMTYENSVTLPDIPNYLPDSIPANTTDVNKLQEMARNILYETPHYIAEGLAQRSNNIKEALNVSYSEKSNGTDVHTALRKGRRYFPGTGGRVTRADYGAGEPARRIKIRKRCVTANTG